MPTSHLTRLQATLEDAVTQTTTENATPVADAPVAHLEEPVDDVSGTETPGLRRSQRSRTRTPLGREYDEGRQASREQGVRVKQGHKRRSAKSKRSEVEVTPMDSYSQYETISEFDRDQLIQDLSKATGSDCRGQSDQELFKLYSTIREQQAQLEVANAAPRDAETTFMSSAPVAVGRGFYLNDPLLQTSFPARTSSMQAPDYPPLEIRSRQVSDTRTEPSDNEDDDDDNQGFLARYPKTNPVARSPSTAGSTNNHNSATESESENAHPLPESLQLRPPRTNRGPSSSRVPTREPTEGTEVVPETDAEILAERIPRYTNPRTYNNTRSHVIPTLQIEETSWQNRLHAEPLVRTHSHIAPSASSQFHQPRHQPTNLPQPCEIQNTHNQWHNNLPTASSTRHRPQTRPSDRETDLSIRKKAAKRRLADTASPLHPIADAQQDKAAIARDQLDGMASTMMGSRSQPQASGHRHTTHANAARARAAASANAQISDEEDEVGTDNDEEMDEADKGPGETAMTGTGRKRKPRTNQLKGPARHVIIIAKLLMWIYILAYGPFLSRETYLLWAPIVYEIAWYHVFPNRPYSRPEDIAYPIMVDNLATLKCNAKVICRPIIEFLMKLRNPVLTQQDIDWNLDIMRWIYPHRFHCTDPRHRRGHYDSVIIPRILSAILFGGENSIGITFHELLDPLPIPALAFVLTMIQFCLSEWKTGRYKPRDLKLGGENGVLDMYDTHIKNLKNYESIAKPHLDYLRKAWIDYAIIYSGASLQGNQELDNLIDVDEFRQGLAEAGSMRHGVYGHKRQRTESAEPEEDPESSRGPRRRVEHPFDEEVARALYDADIEAEQEDDDAMDIDIRHSAARELSYEFPDPSPPTPQPRSDTPPEVNEYGQYSASAKGKGPMVHKD